MIDCGCGVGNLSPGDGDITNEQDNQRHSQKHGSLRRWATRKVRELIQVALLPSLEISGADIGLLYSVFRAKVR